jgi:hypothetical protein
MIRGQNKFSSSPIPLKRVVEMLLCVLQTYGAVTVMLPAYYTTVYTKKTLTW